MLVSILGILLGFVFLVWGANKLIVGASALASNLGISPLIIGLTVVGFGTSAPEFFVSILAALNNTPEIALGNALGSNIANIGLVLGMTALFLPLQVSSKTLKREFPVLLIVTLLVAVFLIDNRLSQLDGMLLMSLLFVLGVLIIFFAKRQPIDDPIVSEYQAELPEQISMGKASFFIGLGLVILPLSSHILVTNAATIAAILGVGNTFIGLTVIAIGTSLPELAAAVIGVMKKEDDIAIGNIIGSNLFNILGVLGIAAIIKPFSFGKEVILRDYLLVIILTFLLYFLSYFFGEKGRLGRFSGGVLFLVFCGYFIVLINSEF